MRKEIFTVKELADYIGCSVDLIYDAINQGFLEASRLGSGVIRITKYSVVQWIKARRITPGVKAKAQKQTLDISEVSLSESRIEPPKNIDKPRHIDPFLNFPWENK